MESIQNLVAKLHPLERKVLPFLSKEQNVDKLIEKTKLSEVEVVRALKWLSDKGALHIKTEEKEFLELGINGKLYAKKGLPEKRFLDAIKNKPLSKKELQKKADLDDQEFNICVGVLKRNNFINIEKGNDLVISSTNKKLDDSGSILINKLTKSISIKELNDKDLIVLEELKKRKDIIETVIKKHRTVELTKKGIELLKIKISDEDFIERITPEVLQNKSWKNKKIRPYNVDSNVPEINGGRRHFVNQSIKYIKQIWLDMGFEEMTGNYIHTSYWDLDALFVPQDHPAREMQDTFYIGEKKFEHGEIPKDYKKIKDAHENGGDSGSKGWGGKWSKDEASKLMLRTHTTVLSALKLYEIDPKSLPRKFFSVGKVFRNEALDWKHLFEFYQVDGIVIDPDVNLKNHKAYLRQFFAKMGFPDVRMRPAHFPYTEPSMEIDVWHPKKKQWVELGGSGIFRPEFVKPLLGIEVPVLAWGLGMGRILSEYFDITDIRDLYKNDIKQLRTMKYWMK